MLKEWRARTDVPPHVLPETDSASNLHPCSSTTEPRHEHTLQLRPRLRRRPAEERRPLRQAARPPARSSPRPTGAMYRPAQRPRARPLEPERVEPAATLPGGVETRLPGRQRRRGPEPPATPGQRSASASSRSPPAWISASPSPPPIPTATASASSLRQPTPASAAAGPAAPAPARCCRACRHRKTAHNPGR